MSSSDEDFPVGLETPGGVRTHPPSSNGTIGSGSQEHETKPAIAPVPSQSGTNRTAKSRMPIAGKRNSFSLDSGPSFTVIPPLEPPVPWMGLPKLRYKYLWTPLGKTDRRPRLSKKNQLDYEIDYLEARLRQLANITQITIGVNHSIGGSGKSTTAIYLASIISDLASVLTYAMSATANLHTTALAKYAGVEDVETADGQAQRVHELAMLPKRDIDLRTVGKMVRRNEFGVRVVAEDRPKRLEKSLAFKTPQFSKVADAIHSVSEMIVFDCGNDNVEPDSIPLEVARRCDVLVVPANVKNDLSLERLASELAIYSDDTESPDAIPLTPGVTRSGSQIPTPEKAERAVVIFTNTSPKHKTEDFAARYLPENFSGVALSVPNDPYISPANPSASRANGMLKRPADPYKIDKYTTYHAFLEAAVAAFEMGVRLQGVQIPEPPYLEK